MFSFVREHKSLWLYFELSGKYLHPSLNIKRPSEQHYEEHIDSKVCIKFVFELYRLLLL